jgi:hypothetical protein
VLPDIFVYLTHGSSNVCFLRLPASEFRDPAIKSKWYQFKPDKSVGSVTNDWEGGFIRLRIFVGPYGDFEDTVRSEQWDVSPSPPPPDNKHLMCNLYQCKNLPAADSNAMSDPYVIFYCGGESISTNPKEKEDTLNPMWYQTLHLNVHCATVFDAPPIVVYVMDHDTTSEDDMLGVCIIPLEEAAVNDPTPKRPQWYSLSMGKPGSELGEILVSFNLFETDMVPTFDLMPEVIDTTVEINVLGLRDLKPALGWVPVNKPFVKFDLNSL